MDPRGYDADQPNQQRLLVSEDAVVWLVSCGSKGAELCGYGPLDRDHLLSDLEVGPPAASLAFSVPAALGVTLGHPTLRADGSVLLQMGEAALLGIGPAGDLVGPIPVAVPVEEACWVTFLAADPIDLNRTWVGCEQAILAVDSAGTVLVRHDLAQSEIQLLGARPQGGVIAAYGDQIVVIDGDQVVETDVLPGIPSAVSSHPVAGLVVVTGADCDPSCAPSPPDPVDANAPHSHEFTVSRLDWDGRPTGFGAAVIGTGDHASVHVTLLADGRVIASLPWRQIVPGNGDAVESPIVMVDTDGTLVDWDVTPAGRVCCTDDLVSGWDGVLELTSIDQLARLRRWAVDPFGTFMDDDRSPFENEIEEIFAAGVTQGCHPTGLLFCPDRRLTRAQLASLLARWLGLGLDAPDRFADDAGSVHEQAINALARAGITLGCETADVTLFCPQNPVSRGQIASFLARAAKLSLAAPDRFADDDGSVHEPAINALAAAGITQGCDAADPSRYCPSQPVPRDQTAALLSRAGPPPTG